MSDSSAAKDRGHVSRRDFLATTGTGIAALAAAGCAPAEQDGVKVDDMGTGDRRQCCWKDVGQCTAGTVRYVS